VKTTKSIRDMWWQWREIKVKVTLKQAKRGSRGIALFVCDLGARRGWVVSVTPRPLSTPGKDPVPIVVHEAG
jgi:hypothetical protein